MLKIALLGELEVTHDGEKLVLPPSKKTRALLAYLAATGRPHRREKLCALFWDLPDDPRGALRWSLSRLRPLLDEPAAARILATRETVAFNPNASEVDLSALRTTVGPGIDTLSTAQIESAAALFRGEFLEGLELPNLHDFHSWCLAEREDLRRLQVKILLLLAKRLADQPAIALSYVRQWAQIDPFNEKARATLLSILIALDRKNEAEQQLDAAVRLFQELGSGAEQPLLHAWRELKKRSRSSPAAVPASAIAIAGALPSESDIHPAAGMVIGSNTMIGRQVELDELAGLLERSRTYSEVRVALVMGEPGLGKSRLVEESVHLARKRGLEHHIGHAYETEVGEPYRPWTEAMGPFFPGHGKLDDPVSTSPSIKQTRDKLFQAFAEKLLAANESGVMLLVFEDIHWWDEASTDLFNYVVHAARRRPVTILVTAREGELPDNPPIQRALRLLRHENLLTEIRLKPLLPDEVKKLVRSVAPEGDPSRIVAESEGNPLFALELARNYAERPDDIPRSVKDLVRDRLDRLPEQAAEVLRWASVLGPVFHSRHLMPLLSVSLDDLIQGFGVLERHGFLRASDSSCNEGAYEFVHNLVRNAIYTSLSEPRRRLMHLKIARSLEEGTAGTKTNAADVAHHAASAGEPGMAASACVAAGRHCLRLFANAEAESLARRGSRYAEKLGDIERVQRLIELRQIETSAHRPADATATMQEIEKLAHAALDNGSTEHARLAFQTLSYLRWEGGLWLGAERDMLQAEMLSRSGDDKERVVAMGEAARCLVMLERDLPHAESLALEASALAHRKKFESSAVFDANGLLRWHQGQCDEAADYFQRAREAARRDGARDNEFLALEHWATMEVQRRRFPDAALLCAELRHLAERLREGSEAPYARALEAACEIIDGHLDALPRLHKALSDLRTADAKHRLTIALLIAAETAIERDDLLTARRWALEALRLSELMRRHSEVVHAKALLTRIASEENDTIPLKDSDYVLVGGNDEPVSWLARQQAELARAKVPKRLARRVNRGR